MLRRKQHPVYAAMECTLQPQMQPLSKGWQTWPQSTMHHIWKQHIGTTASLMRMSTSGVAAMLSSGTASCRTLIVLIAYW